MIGYIIIKNGFRISMLGGKVTVRSRIENKMSQLSNNTLSIKRSIIKKHLFKINIGLYSWSLISNLMNGCSMINSIGLKQECDAKTSTGVKLYVTAYR